MSEVTERIRGLGHWDVAILPEPYNPDRVPYERLDSLLERSAVRLRGWPLPMVDRRDGFLHGQDWIGQDIDANFVAHAEAWRFFTSGQFAQLRAVSADVRTGRERTAVPAGAETAIEVWEVLFFLTELTELAARLAVTPAGDDTVTVTATLRRTRNRALVAGTPERELNSLYVATAEDIIAARTVERDRLVAEAAGIAVEMSQDVFLRFGFKAATETLASYQSELTRRR